MKEDEIDQGLFQKGFNHAYWLTLDNDGGKEVLKGIESRNNSKSYGAGLEKGKQEATRDKFIEEIREASKKKEKGRDL